DVPAAFAGRSMAARLDVVLRVEDPLGIASGSWRLESGSDGSCRAVSAPDTEAEIELGVGELSSLYLGGVSARSLAQAGRVRGDAAAVASLDAALRIDGAPFLSIMY